MLSFQLAEAPDRAALTLYSSRPDVFGTGTLNLAAVFAAHAKILLTSGEHSPSVEGLERAIGTRRQIDMAIETLMDVHDVSEETAFAMLRVTSDHLNRRLRDIADDVARTGRLPTRDSSNE
jgi:hypothetical protein